MTFYAIEIEPCQGLGFVGGPRFQTNIANLQNGRESRNAEWSITRHAYTAQYKNITDEGFRAVKKVFLIVRGRCHTFLFKDWGDYQAQDEQFGVGDGSKTTFYLKKVSSDGGGNYVRTIDKPVAGAVIKVNGAVVSAAVSTLDGSVVFSSAPANGAVLTWSGEFRVHVRFDTDALPFSIDDKGPSSLYTNGSIDLIEVLDE